MTGFTYRGLHSIRDIGIIFKTVARPPCPPPRIKNETIPYRDGSIDYSDEHGRIYYDDKVLELELSIVDKGIIPLHEKITKVVSWLAGGYSDLIFDDMPLTVWNAMPVSLDAIAPELARVGKTTVQFRCTPFNNAMFDSGGPVLGSDILLNSDIPIGFGEEIEFDLQSGQNTLDFSYIGTAYSSPQLYFTDTTATTVTVTCNGKTISYDGDIDGLVIDCKRYSCLYNETDVSSNAAGDYFEFSPGQSNQIKITCNAAAHVEVIYELSFFYGVTGL